jgi:hypothetical protein
MKTAIGDIPDVLLVVGGFGRNIQSNSSDCDILEE